MDMNTELKGENKVQAVAKEKRVLTPEQKEAWKKKEQEKRENRKKGAKEILDLLDKNKLFDKLSDNAKTTIQALANANTEIGAPKGNTFAAMFGPTPKVGQSVTLLEVMSKTLKGKGVIDAYVKTWKEKGIVVEYTADAKDPVKSTYTIKALPSA